MLIAHTADWHLDASKFLNNSLKRQEHAIREVYRIADKYDVKVLLIAGDIFNHHNISEEARNTFFKLITFAERKYSFTSVFINGNHDIYKTENSVVSLFKDVSNLFLPKTRIIDMEPELLSIDELDIMAIPFMESLNDDKFKALIDNGYNTHKGQYYVPMAHYMIKGCIRDNGSKSPSGLELPKTKWNYLALGDIHKNQKVGDNAYYCGSPIQHNFGEGLPKGMMIIDLKRDKKKFVEIKSPKIRKLLTIKTVPDKWPENAYIKFKGKEAPQDLPDSVIKITTEIEQEDVSTDIQLDDITLGLPEFAASRGLKKKAQSKLVRLATKYLDRIKDRE